MHTGTQRKMSADADGCPAREQGKASPARLTRSHKLFYDFWL